MAEAVGKPRRRAVQHGSIGADELGQLVAPVDDELSEDGVHVGVWGQGLARAGERILDVEDLAGDAQGRLQDGKHGELGGHAEIARGRQGLRRGDPAVRRCECRTSAARGTLQNQAGRSLKQEWIAPATTQCSSGYAG